MEGLFLEKHPAFIFDASFINVKNFVQLFLGKTITLLQLCLDLYVGFILSEKVVEYDVARAVVPSWFGNSRHMQAKNIMSQWLEQ